MQTLELKIDGMTCGGCVNSVSRVLKAQAGVDDAQVELGLAVIRFDPAVTDAGKLRAAVEDAGYAVI